MGRKENCAKFQIDVPKTNELVHVHTERQTDEYIYPGRDITTKIELTNRRCCC